MDYHRNNTYYVRLSQMLTSSGLEIHKEMLDELGKHFALTACVRLSLPG